MNAPGRLSLKNRPPPPLHARIGRAIRRALLAPLPRTLQLRLLMWRTGRAWGRAMDDARARKVDADEVQSIDQGWHMEYQTLEDEYEAIYSRRLVNKAVRFRVPCPEPPYVSENREDENWRQRWYGGGWHLKPEGIKKVRAEIRAERRARAELLVQWLSPLIGVIGAVTGLVAVILR